ncbi:hypothetical protein NQ317_000178 [Molorchus minor]|uniref:Uncharacterized protein n=1 Tax=Molorchus minor TaxID=1323400 RepID=A0ABQ9IUM5_9CUCU|nr:hypothetical protein NQ317_000178 [Molorchus minor]
MSALMVHCRLQSNSDTPHRSVLNGIRAKPRGQGAENVVPSSSRNCIERQPPVPTPTISLSPSSNNVPNGSIGPPATVPTTLNSELEEKQN